MEGGGGRFGGSQRREELDKNSFSTVMESIEFVFLWMLLLIHDEIDCSNERQRST